MVDASLGLRVDIEDEALAWTLPSMVNALTASKVKAEI